jgi:hypothetical protein
VLPDPRGESDTARGRSATRLALNTVNRDGPLGAELVDGGLERLGQRHAVEGVTGLFAEMPEKYPVSGGAVLAGSTRGGEKESWPRLLALTSFLWWSCRESNPEF